MTITSDELVDEDGWSVNKLFNDGEFSHYVLNYELESGSQAVSFDEVRADGGLLHLNRNGERSITFTGVLDGSNKYDGGDIPKVVFEELKDIGPY